MYVLEGRFDLLIDGKEVVADAGDLVCLLRTTMHGIFNKTDQTVKSIFWVSPAAKLWDFFARIDNVPDPAEVTRVATQYEVEFAPPED